jgi:hypothetical protein
MQVRHFAILILAGLLSGCVNTTSGVSIRSVQTADSRHIVMSTANEIWRVHLAPDGQPLQKYAAQDGVFRSGLRVRDLAPEEIVMMLRTLDESEARGRAIEEHFEQRSRAIEEHADQRVHAGRFDVP